MKKEMHKFAIAKQNIEQFLELGKSKIRKNGTLSNDNVFNSRAFGC